MFQTFPLAFELKWDMIFSSCDTKCVHNIGNITKARNIDKVQENRDPEVQEMAFTLDITLFYL